MNAIRKPNKRRAVSPVIATVILVAVTITVAVAVSYWMSSIAGQYTGFEKVEIQSGYSTKTEFAEGAEGGTWDPVLLEWTVLPIPDTVDGWKITIKLKNTGSAPSTITSCFVNEKPIEEYSTDAITCKYLVVDYAPPADPVPDFVDLNVVGVTLESGTTAVLYVNIVEAGVTFTSGTTVNVKLHSAGGMDYIRLIQLS